MTSTTQQEEEEKSSSKVEEEKVEEPSSSSPSVVVLPSFLYIEREIMTALELSEASAGGPGLSWFIPGVGAEQLNLCQEGRTYQPLEDAPTPLLAIARQLEETIEGVWLPASESDTKGRAFVITSSTANSSDSSSDTNDKNDDGNDHQRMPDNQVRDICLDALGIIDEARVHATFRRRDWSSVDAERNGFCYTDEDFEDLDDDNELQSDRAKVIEATRVMATELQDGFELNFDDEIICGPVLYGGLVVDDTVEGQQNNTSIVGILSMRVWT